MARAAAWSPSATPSPWPPRIEQALLPEARARAVAFRAQISEEYGAARLCRQLENLYDGLLVASGRLAGPVRARTG